MKFLLCLSCCSDLCTLETQNFIRIKFLELFKVNEYIYKTFNTN